VFLRRFAALTAVLAIGVAACSGANSNVADPLPHGPTLSATGTPLALSGVAGTSGSVTVTGTGNVSASESTTPPGSLPAISSVARASGTTTQSVKTTATAAATAVATAAAAAAGAVKPQAAIPNTALVYFTFTAVNTATITGIPASSFTFATAPTGSVFLAFYNPTTAAWQTIGTAGTVSNSTVTFGAATLSPTQSLATGATLSFVVYTGSVIVAPTPAPSPTATATSTGSASPSPSPTGTGAAGPVLADGGFENPSTAVAFGGTIGTTGWTQCTVTTLTPGITFTGGLKGAVGGGGTYAAATPPPVPGATPTPTVGTTPAAVIAAAGTTVGVGTFTPISTQTSVPVHGGGFAAQFGQVYNNFNAANYRYNGLCQKITVPANGATLNGFVFEAGSESGSFTEDLIGSLDAATSTTLTQLYWMENIETSATGTDSGYRAIGPITLTPGLQTLFVGQWTKSGSTGATFDSSFWWVDDLSITPS
jgi:hypothetical protein